MHRASVNSILISPLRVRRRAVGSCRYVAAAPATASSERGRWWTTKADLSEVVVFGVRCLFPLFWHVLQMPSPEFIV